MKRRYEKPTVASERVFSLASQGCDVNRESPGVCANNITYEPCYPFSYKVRNLFCGDPGQNPTSRS
jgi:hypothetical protein